MRLNAETIEHIKRLEALRLRAYPDPGSRNGEPWTIGYGHTSDMFMKVRRGMEITQEQADAALEWDLEEAAVTVRSHIKVPLTENQFGALVSFVFNVGGGNFGKSTLLKKLNAGNYSAVPGELAKWVFNDGKRMAGLVNRRAAEAALWSKTGAVAGRTTVARTSGFTQAVLQFLGWLKGVV